MRTILAVLLLFALNATAQVSTAPPLLNFKGTTLPTNCQVGRLFFKTDATAGNQIYSCSATDTWTQILGAGSTPGGSTTQVQYNNAGAFGGISQWTTNGTTTLTGSSTSVLAANTMYLVSVAANTGYAFGSGGAGGGFLLLGSSLGVGISAGATIDMAFFNSASRVHLRSTSAFGWSSTDNASGTQDLIMTRAAAANIQFGAANAASPIAQIIQSQGSRSATDSNVAGANFTIRSGAGTGNATPSMLILQSYVAVASGTGAQTLTTGLTIDRGTAVTVGYTVAALPAGGAAGSRAHVTDQLTACVATGVAITGGGAVTCPVFYNGSAWVGG